MKLLFTEEGWEDYVSCQQDRRVVKQVHKLIADIQRHGHVGLGRPEELRGDQRGWWSRRIDEKNRLIYRFRDDAVEIAQCGGHYQDH